LPHGTTLPPANAQRWRRQAKEARAMAGEMTAKDNQDALHKIAAQYDRLAEEADKRERAALKKL